MKYERSLARRIQREGKSGFSRPIMRLSVMSISLGLAVMLISVSILEGFQRGVREKVAGFHADIQVSNFDFNDSYELPPIYADSTVLSSIEEKEHVNNTNVFALKGGILKTDNLIHGVVLKGIDKKFHWEIFNQWIIKGDTLDLHTKKRSRDILISKVVADKLLLDTGDQVIMYFIQKPPRVDKFTIRGIYHSGFVEFDSRFVIGDIRKIQKLNKWDSNQAAGIEVWLDDPDQMASVKKKLQKELDYSWKIKTVVDRFPFIMEWLELLDTNIYFILILMILISGITMISTLLIMILERTTMIGVLKSLGASNSSIQKIFIYISMHLISRGLIYGNLIALSLLGLQYFFEIIPLDPGSYYIDSVPVVFNVYVIAILNIATIALIGIMLLWPSFIVSKIRPIKALRFD